MSFKLKICCFIVFNIIFIFFLPKVVFAVSLTNQSDQTTLTAGEEFLVNTTLNINSDNGTIYYLRGVFYKVGTEHYCGYTWNGTNWYNGPYTTGEGWKNLLLVQISEASWSGILKAKIDQGDSNCSDSGEYKFKIQRYTVGGTATFDTQNELVVNVQIPTSTPTPTLTPTPTSTSPTPTSTPEPTSTPTPTLTPTPQPPTPTPTTKPSLTPTSTPIPSLTPTPTGGVLGEETASESGFYNLTDQEITPIENISTASGETEGKREFLFPILTAILGIGFISFSVFSFLKGRQPKNSGLTD